jgi:hypothetical protein
MVTMDVRAGSRPAPLRLTQRGRVVVLMFFVLMASLASAVLFATASRASDPPTGPAPTVVVEEYDTMWAIAQRAEPDHDPYAVMAEIRRLNGLDSYVVHAGQILTLPRDN